MKLRDFTSEELFVEGTKLQIYFESDEYLPTKVNFDFEFENEDGQPGQKTLTRMVDCLPAARKREVDTRLFAYQLEWTIDLQGDGEVRERFVKIKFKAVRRVGMTAAVPINSFSPESAIVVGIDITSHPALTRIMLHEFSTSDGSAFDPEKLRPFLAKLTIQQRRLLVGSGYRNPEGRLVVLVTLYPRGSLRMYADLTESTTGVVPNATFSVFFCRNDSTMKVPRRMKWPTPSSTSPVTLICHTQYLCVCLVNGRTQAWLNPPAGKRDVPGVYGGRRPNEWLRKDTKWPVKFVIAALQPTSSVSSRGIWHAIYEAKSGHNIMPGNSVHGMINTKGCWMLFRNFNWPGPEEVRKELYRIYRFFYRVFERTGKGEQAVIAELKKTEYNVETAMNGKSSSYAKFIRYDRNFAYLWFCHEIVGIKYYSDTDFWKAKETVNVYKVAGREMLNTFPISEAGKPPEYNDRDEGNHAYHEFDHYDRDNLKIGPNLFQENAVGIKTASDFSKDMQGSLTPAQLTSCTWADVYFYKEDGLDAEGLRAKDVEEP